MFFWIAIDKMELWIICTCFGLFTMSIILGIVIVYIIDKKLSNIIIKIPKLEPVIINKTVQVDGGKDKQITGGLAGQHDDNDYVQNITHPVQLPNDIRYWDEVPIQGRIHSPDMDVTINQKRKNIKAK